MSNTRAGKHDDMRAASDNLSREKIQRLLSAIGSQPPEETTQIEALDYDWHQPHYFTNIQLKRLDDFTKKIGKAIAGKFIALCPGEFTVTVDSATQLFAGKVREQALDVKDNDYYLAFGTTHEQLCGLVGIPAQTAFAWATQLLGDPASERNSSRDLSQLEESLLLDTACAIVEALADAHGGCVFLPANELLRTLLPLDLQNTQEFCKISFSIKKTDSDSTQAYLLIRCRDLVPIVGKARQDAGKFSAEHISKAILGRLQHMPVCITARLASIELPFKELMSLTPGDILLLDKKIDETIELIVEGRAFFCGRPAKSGDKYAVVITEDPKHASQALEPAEPSHDAARNTGKTKDT